MGTRGLLAALAIAVGLGSGCGGGGGGGGGTGDPGGAPGIGDGVDVLVLFASAGDRLGLAAGRDVVEKLEGTGAFRSVTLVDAAYTRPDADDLAHYDAVLVATYYAPFDAETLGDALADYVDRGGGVVMALYSFEPGAVGVQGRFVDGGYCALVPGTSYVAGDGPLSLGTLHDPDHPILRGVTRFEGGARSARPATLEVADGAVRVADWSDGTPFVATRAVGDTRRADLGFFPPSADAYAGMWWDPETDGALLLSNALLWVAGAD